jgi:hypothetical protein
MAVTAALAARMVSGTVWLVLLAVLYSEVVSGKGTMYE